MKTALQLSKNFREVYFGGNWTESSVKQHVTDVGWQEATARIDGFNTIAMLTYHIHYYVDRVLRVLEGSSLEGHDRDSFAHPAIRSEHDWTSMLEKMWTDAEKFASHVAEIPEEKLGEIFFKEKYGNYYRNLAGIIEHVHYHLGQIVIIKKLVRERSKREQAPA